MSRISDKLKIAYEAKGLSYQELSRMCKIPRATIQRYVTGTTDRIDIDKLQAICRVLDVDEAEVIGWSDDSRNERNGLTLLPNGTATQQEDLEIVQLLNSLSDSSRKQALSYLRFLSAQEDKQ